MSAELIILSFFFLFGGVGGGLFLTLRGWHYYDMDRRICGALLVATGILIGFLGLGVWWSAPLGWWPL